ncbi:MAG: hypothetical protein CVV25_02040 [Ignavibacteriae bacterium HGW-Ignavibacteriae-4]|jgi:hypothetical protein|nr:MAG: hypothetical protein CVV25_02040 [Ignavibacteriae bacterium HGW-Ignavibacteriae-4]
MKEKNIYITIVVEVMKILVFIIGFIIQFSSLNSKENEQYDNISTLQKVYIVVADTSYNYTELNKLMRKISSKFNLKIDTLGRTYDSDKDLICLPEDDEDEIYAGDYFPRRYSSDYISLEYLDYYKEANLRLEAKTIALVVMISSDKLTSESMLRKIKQYSKNAFIFEGKVDFGCMH